MYMAVKSRFDEWQDLTLEEFTHFKSLKLLEKINVKKEYDANIPIKQALLSVKPTAKPHETPSAKALPATPSKQNDALIIAQRAMQAAYKPVEVDLDLIEEFKTKLPADEKVQYEGLTLDNQSELANMYKQLGTTSKQTPAKVLQLVHFYLSQKKGGRKTKRNRKRRSRRY